MSSTVPITVHPSQFPDAIRRDLLRSLRQKQIHPKFLYDSVQQAQLWLDLHDAWSPARADAGVTRIYQAAFQNVLQALPRSKKTIHLIGLGTGGGQKETRFLRQLRRHGRNASFSPVEVSVALALTSHRAARGLADPIEPIVCDLATARDLTRIFSRGTTGPRVITCFGMLPNFEPARLLSLLRFLLKPGDHLLLSANLAPGPDYAAGVDCILPQYDNPETSRWLLSFLTHVGINPRHGKLEFKIESARGLKRVVAAFNFRKRTFLAIGNQSFQWQAGENLRLFFSYRYTPQLLAATLGRFGLRVEKEWISSSGEEGVFQITPSIRKRKVFRGRP